MKNSDEALEALKELRRSFDTLYATDASLTETDTRCKLIDRTLKEILNWDEADIRREKSTHQGYADYILSAKRPLVVLEAKRAGIYFTLPTELNRPRFTLTGVIRKSPELDAAIEQVRDYCSDEGIQYAVVSNGYQYVFFRAVTTDGTPWRNGEAIVFNGFSDIESRFSEFWNLLERNAVSLGKLVDALSKQKSEPRTGQRPLDSYHQANELIGRNILNAELAPIVRTIFEDITNEMDPGLLKACYCESEQVVDYTRMFSQEVRKEMPHFLAQEKAIEVEHREKKESQLKHELDIETTRHRPASFLLLGGIGVGKTTFLYYLFNGLPKDVESKLVWIYVDFRDFRIQSDTELKRYVLAQVKRAIDNSQVGAKINSFQTIQQILSPLITKELMGPLGIITDSKVREVKLSERVSEWLDNPDIFLPALFSYIQNTLGIRVCLLFDNADQMHFENQQIVYSYALHLAKTSSVMALISLREESYYASSRIDVFSAHHNRKFHIAGPNVITVLRTRLQFALGVLKKEDHPLMLRWGGGLNVQVDDIRQFMKILYASILRTSAISPHGKLILGFIEALSGGNARVALDMFNTFLLCGHTNVKKILDKYLEEGSYDVPFHEFARSVTLQDYRYYRADRSVIVNLFEPIAGGASHFTTLRLLGLLKRHLSDGSTVGRGFVDIETLSRATLFAGINSEETSSALDKLLKKGLIEADTRTSISIGQANYLRLTPSGDFYLTTLVKKFVYLDLALQDTAIYDAVVFERLRDVLPEVSVKRRLDRTQWFIGYLMEEERKELAGIPASADPALIMSYSKAIDEEFRREKPAILQSERKNARRKA